MILRIGTYYFNVEDVELEKKIKLFEEVESVQGDFSYSFELPKTSELLAALSIPLPDNKAKTVYNVNDSELISDQGESIALGYLRVETITDIISMSFFSGNSNWIAMIGGKLSEIDFSDLNQDQTEANVISSWQNESGLIYQLMDNNVLLNRRSPRLKVEDFIPSIYVHTIISRIFREQSIKLTGELFDDPTYQKLTITKSPVDQIESRSAYVNKTSTQTVGDPPDLLTFEDDFTFPFFDGEADNYKVASSEYLADVKMRLLVQVSAQFNNPSILSTLTLYIVKNGSAVAEIDTFAGSLVSVTLTLEKEVVLDAGDNITISAQSTSGFGTDISIATVKFTPTYLYYSFADSTLPDWTQAQMVSNVFKLFNVIPVYDQFTKTLRVNLFDKLSQKEAIDISEHVVSVETDYTTFISNYFKRSNFVYEKVEFDDWKQNGISNYFQSGDGFLTVNNDFLDPSGEVIESDFTNPQAYINTVFDMSMERLNTLALEEIDSTEVTSVSDSSGVARFTVTDDVFEVGDLGRIETDFQTYSGDWIVSAVGTGWVEFHDLPILGDATGTIRLMKHIYTGDDDVYLTLVIPNYIVDRFSSLSSFNLETTNITEIAVGYFNLMNTGRQINSSFQQSLSFGRPSSVFAYQLTLLQGYWNMFSRMVNDPVMLRAECNLPDKTFRDLDFLRPVFVTREETTNLYYLNRITGYRGSHLPCILEIIKLP